VLVGAIGTVGVVSLALALRHPPRAMAATTAAAIAARVPPANPPPAHEEPAAASVQAQPPRVEVQQGPRRPFNRQAAVRALDGQWRRVAKCRRGNAWGKGPTTIHFATDGSITDVTVDAPFSGTPTGQCIAETLADVRVEPFAGQPTPLVYRVYVAP
jgi:hypothetical protein